MQLFSQPPITAFAPTVIPDHTPVYRIKEGQFFVDDDLYVAGSIIAYEGEPNLEMEPLNKLALEAMRTYLAKLDNLGRKVAEKNGVAYISYADAFNNSMQLAKEEGKRVSLLNGQQQVPLMGGKRKKKSVTKIEVERVSSQPVLTVGEKSEVNDTQNTGL